MSRAIYAGSFDPLTNGHIWMIEKGASLFEKLVVAIGSNPDKKYHFSLDERLMMLKKSVGDMFNVRIVSFENKFLVDYAADYPADYILRGIRSESDYEYERNMMHINNDLKPLIETVFLMPPRGISEVSSSLINGLVGLDGWESAVRRYVPTPVYKHILKKKRESYSPKERWNDLLRRLGIEKGFDFFTDIKQMYLTPTRDYHNLNHIQNCLSEFEMVRDEAEPPEVVELAIWFHDIIYDPHANDNEEESAKVAEQFLGGHWLQKSFINAVVDLILATKHDEKVDNMQEKIMVDIDLSIFGQEPEVFDRYEMAIRSEYFWVPMKEFATARIKILQGFLDRSSIYHTEKFSDRYEAQARVNLQSCIDTLSNFILGDE